MVAIILENETKAIGHPFPTEKTRTGWGNQSADVKAQVLTSVLTSRDALVAWLIFISGPL